MKVWFSLEFHARTLSGLEDILAGELVSLNAKILSVGRRLVVFSGALEQLYLANLCCRTAIRILLPIHQFAARSEAELYDGVGQIDWQIRLGRRSTLAVDPLVRNSFCTHSLYAAQLVKDAVVDQLRQATGKRPSVDRDNPDLRIGLYLNDNQATIYLDSSGDSLHKRGYRKQTGKAPLSEALAAGILLSTQWDRRAPLIDPMCGAGTFAIEAALLSADIAPGLLGRRYGFQNWPDYDGTLFERLIGSLREKVRADGPPIFASDEDPKAIAAAKANARAAGVEARISFDVSPMETCPVPPPPGIVVLNPPYDERLELQDAVPFYQRIGDVLKHRFAGRTAHLLTGNLSAAKHVGLKTSKKTILYNGAIECRLLRYELFQSKGTAPSWRQPGQTVAVPPKWRDQLQMYENRLSKMAKHWGKWARRQGVGCYRIYDRDIPDVPLTVDWYEGRLHMAEYDRPHDRSSKEHQDWLDLVLRKTAQTLDVPLNQTHLKRRERQKGDRQYARQQQTDAFITVQEAGLKFFVNLSDYLDTGLFLDHRLTRAMVKAHSENKRFLNLFAYTGSFTVYAASGGARSTTTVDTSNTYLDWARQNLQINGLAGGRHSFHRSDAFEFLLDREGIEMFDLAVVDPPTFSNNKSGRRVFDIQQDHVRLLQLTLSTVATGGLVYFSTNRRKFRFEFEDSGFEIREITSQTVPPDFQRKRPHRCWLIRKH